IPHLPRAARLSAGPFALLGRSWLPSRGVWPFEGATRGPLPQLAMQPSSRLLSVGRPDDLGRLFPGAVVSDYDVSPSGPPWPTEWFSDPRSPLSGTPTSAGESGVSAPVSDVVRREWALT